MKKILHIMVTLLLEINMEDTVSVKEVVTVIIIKTDHENLIEARG